MAAIRNHELNPAERADSDEVLLRGGEVEDAVSSYLRDIGTIPLLTAAEEVALATAIDAGKVAGKKLDDSPLATAERRIAIREKESGEHARRKMVESNLRLVVSIARRYTGRGVPLSDLIEEGNLGLMRATEKFDHRRGFRFSTYATWWIRQAVTRAIANQSRVVRIPVHVTELIGQVSKATHQLSQVLGREPTSEEIAREVHVSPERVREIIKASQQPISLEHPFGDGGEGTVGEVVEDRSLEQPADEVQRDMLREQVQAALSVLSEREQKVLDLRYGLSSDRDYTLEEVGSLMGVTRERIRQIEKEALWKLRHTSDSDSLRAFLG